MLFDGIHQAHARLWVVDGVDQHARVTGASGLEQIDARGVPVVHPKIEAPQGIDVEVVDLRTLRPLDHDTILASVHKTGRLLVADIGWKTGGFGDEVVALAVEHGFASLRCPPRRLGMLDLPTPSTPALARFCYPRMVDVVQAVAELAGRAGDIRLPEDTGAPLDVPDSSFTGPF